MRRSVCPHSWKCFQIGDRFTCSRKARLRYNTVQRGVGFAGQKNPKNLRASHENKDAQVGQRGHIILYRCDINNML